MESRPKLIPRPTFIPRIASLCVAMMLLVLPGTAQSTGKAKDKDKSVAFECIGTYGETIQSAELYSHYIFLNQGFTIRVLDIADPVHPKEIDVNAM